MPQRSRSQWQSLLREQQASGLSQTSFCQSHGINPNYFSTIKKRLSKPDGFVQAVVSPGTLVTATIRYGDQHVQLNGASARYVAEVLKALS